MPSAATTYFDRTAGEFAGLYGHDPDFRQRVEVWKALLDSLTPGRRTAYDLGCGDGIFTIHLAEKGLQVTGVDASENMLGRCRRRLEPRPELPVTLRHSAIPADVADWPPADLVIASSLLEYLPDFDGAIRMMGRLLHPGGTLVVSLPNRQSLYRRGESFLFRLTGHPRYLTLVHHLMSAGEAAGRIEALGFDHLQTRYYANRKSCWPICRLMLGDAAASKLFVSAFRKHS